MSRILAIDYGRKRCGIAVTDPLQIVATGLPTVRTCDLPDFLHRYLSGEDVELVVVGLPKTMTGEASESERYIAPFLKQFKREFPDIPVVRYDERFTSAIAHRSMLDAGFRRSQRREKGRVDEMAAVIILNDYLSARK